jgi:hypothetical protein
MGGKDKGIVVQGQSQAKIGKNLSEKITKNNTWGHGSNRRA